MYRGSRDLASLLPAFGATVCASNAQWTEGQPCARRSCVAAGGAARVALRRVRVDGGSRRREVPVPRRPRAEPFPAGVAANVHRRTRGSRFDAFFSSGIGCRWRRCVPVPRWPRAGRFEAGVAANVRRRTRGSTNHLVVIARWSSLTAWRDLLDGPSRRCPSRGCAGLRTKVGLLAKGLRDVPQSWSEQGTIPTSVMVPILASRIAVTGTSRRRSARSRLRLARRPSVVGVGRVAAGRSGRRVACQEREQPGA